ncbi:G patch domain-containing protein 1 isoform X2 [Heptranchias perlo]|uniref:G patch domain-containing protein 1 isoform X2 n=1 Tax=Heptranchias perlo TaxID=212740 RepID=UPI00355A6654
MAAAEEESGDEAEDFAIYGLALEPLEEDESTKKPIPLQEQTVKDEKGRYKRFHGAFTGGFSAGYFNSVGSKEGWAPSTFVSTRQQKAEKQLFRPEDFMDEEDLKEHGIAPKGITTTDDFASKTKDRLREKSRALATAAAPIPGATILDDLIAAAKITIGVQLLRKMGWKEGQGLGPRVKRKPRGQRCDAGTKVYGCSRPDEGSQEEEDEYQPENVTFAPKDVMLMDFTPKDNRHGVGYSGIDPRRALYGGSAEGSDSVFNTDSDRSRNLLADVQSSKGRKLGITGQAFGVGALEEDDDDIYARDTLSRYDTVLREEEPGDGLFGWTAPQQYKKEAKGLDPQTGYVGKCLEGFSLASTSSRPKKIYGPPELPRDYRPVHYFRPVVAPGTVSTAMAEALVASAGQLSTDAGQKGRHQLNSTQRRELLGEDALQGPRSVFELLTGKDKERLKEAQQKQQSVCRVPASQDLTDRSQSTAWEKPWVSQLAIYGGGKVTGSSEFKPFVKNPEKQKRYEEYVEKLNSGQNDALDSSLDPNMTEWERSRERDEFSRAATLYRPTSSSLSSRFTSAKFAEDTDKVEVPEELEGEVKDKEAAVKMKMFGSLTRDKFEWHPEKLLCKRFNVPDPYPRSTIAGLLKVKRDKYSVFNFLTVPTAPTPSGLERKRENLQQDKSATSKPPESRRRSRWDISAEDKEKDAVGNVPNPAASCTAAETSSTLQTEKEIEQDRGNQPADKAEAEEGDSRPSMDLFKAIFASSSEEKSSSSSSDEGDEDEDEEETSQIAPPPGVRDAVEPKQPAPPTIPRPVNELGFSQKESDQNLRPAQCGPEKPADGEEFGPRLPPALLIGSPVPGCERPEGHGSSTSHQKEKHKKKHKDRQKGKKPKKDKKKKHKKHKHKSKQRSKNPRGSDSSGSGPRQGSSESDSDREGGGSGPVDLLSRLKNLPLARR